MATQVRTEGERIAILEGQIAQLATKADISVLDSNIESPRAEMNRIQWIISIAILAAIAVGTVVQVLNNLPG